MSPDAIKTDKGRDAALKRWRDWGNRVGADLMRRLKASSSWQMLLALALVLVSVAGLCRVSGLYKRLAPLPAPTATSTSTSTSTSQPTRTLLPTWTLTSVPSATPTATPVPVVIPGGHVLVSGTGAQQLRLRAGPGLTQEMLGTLEDGTQLQVLEGPEAADGHEWWKLRTDDGLEGWAAGDWLVPVAP